MIIKNAEAAVLTCITAFFFLANTNMAPSEEMAGSGDLLKNSDRHFITNPADAGPRVTATAVDHNGSYIEIL